MTAAVRHLEIPPRLLSREEAAAYVGLSPTTFDLEVAAGTFPGPFPLTSARRRLWDIRALDAAIDRKSGINAGANDREARKRAFQERRQGRAQANG